MSSGLEKWDIKRKGGNILILFTGDKDTYHMVRSRFSKSRAGPVFDDKYGGHAFGFYLNDVSPEQEKDLRVYLSSLEGGEVEESHTEGPTEEFSEEVVVGLYESSKKIPTLKVHAYKIKATGDVVDKAYQVGGRVSASLRKSLQNAGPIVGRRFKVYSLEQLSDLGSVSDGYEIQYSGEEVLEAGRDHRVIEQFITQLIKRNIDRTEFKVGFRNETYRREPFLVSPDGNVDIYRGFRHGLFLQEDGTVLLSADVTHSFQTKQTIKEIIDSGQSVDGLEVAHVYDGNTGRIAFVADYTISDSVEALGNRSLKEYHLGEGRERFLKDVADDEMAVMVSYGEDKGEYPHIPSLLRRVIRFDVLKSLSPDFVGTVSHNVKMEIHERLSLVREFIEMLGTLDYLDISFSKDPVKAHDEAIDGGEIIRGVNLLFGNGKTYPYPTIGLKSGSLFKAPDTIRIGLLYPIRIKKGAKDFFEKMKSYMKRMFDITLELVNEDSYEYGSRMEYKKVATTFSPENVDVLLTVVPEYIEMDDVDDPYNPFKRIFAKIGIPSQMVQDTNLSKPFVKTHIALGMVCKAGGVPWKIKHLPGDPDCFIGFDISHRGGVHMAASAHLFTPDGSYLGWNCISAQKGEKMDESDFVESIEDHILNYKKKYGKFPNHVVIHRDGMFREEQEQLETMLNEQGIGFDLVEIRKTGAPRIGYQKTPDYISRPQKGTYVKRGNMAFLCTTGYPEYKLGTPQPIIVNKVKGKTSLDDLVCQVYWLSEMHVGSTKSTRLPITTHYADKCSTLAQDQMLPMGTIQDKLYFV